VTDAPRDSEGADDEAADAPRDRPSAANTEARWGSLRRLSATAMGPMERLFVPPSSAARRSGAAIVVLSLAAVIADLLILRGVNVPGGAAQRLMLVGSVVATLTLGLVAASGMVRTADPRAATIGGLAVVLLFVLGLLTSTAGIALAARDHGYRALHAQADRTPGGGSSGGDFDAGPDETGGGGDFGGGSSSTFPATSTVSNPPPAAGSTSPSQACPRLILYFSRGSGQPITGERSHPRGLAQPGTELYRSLIRTYGTTNVRSIENAYPAVSIQPSRPHPAGLASYKRSVAAGVRAAVRNLTDIHLVSPHSRFVVGGYSQGAEVTRGALADLGSPQRRAVAAVVLFGDPYFSAHESNVHAEPPAHASTRFHPRQRGVARQFRFGRVTAIERAYVGKVFSWCRRHDVICQGVHARNGLRAHGRYDEDAGAAATQIATILRPGSRQP
jgi:hypothetical protein